MQTIKHTDTLWKAYGLHVTAKGCGIVAKGGYDDHCIVERVDGRTYEEASGNAILISNAPWYRVLALIAADGGARCGLMWVRIPYNNTMHTDAGWCLSVKDKNWQWSGTVDPFGVPVAPPQKMFNEIKQAIESL